MVARQKSCGELLAADFCKQCTQSLSPCTLQITGLLEWKQNPKRTKIHISIEFHTFGCYEQGLTLCLTKQTEPVNIVGSKVKKIL